jgi:hypothetical protein
LRKIARVVDDWPKTAKSHLNHAKEKKFKKKCKKALTHLWQSEKVASHTEIQIKIMRTKTMLLSALLGTLGSVSVMAQGSTNVYSLNVVGYVNVTIPASSYSIVSCPLLATPDNTLNTLLPNSTGTYLKVKVYFYSAATGSYTIETGTKSAWQLGGTETLNPGQAAFILNPNATPLTLTFVGSVASGSQNNVITPGYNLVSSILPASGDLATNSLTLLTNAVTKDKVYVFDATTQAYNIYTAAKAGAWSPSDPIVPNVGEGFFYENNNGTTSLTWTENFSVSTP